MQHEIELAYIGLEARNPKALNQYLGDTIGLMAGALTCAGHATWRVDAKAHRLIVQPGVADEARFLGFEATSDEVFQRVRARTLQQGVIWREAGATECAERRVTKLARTRAPWDVDIELVTGLQQSDSAFKSEAFPRGCVTAGQGFGHVVFRLGDPESYRKSRAFANALGLHLSDWLELQLPQGPMHVSFLHCNARHHSIALACVPPALAQARRLHHINFEVADLACVGAAFDRALNGGTPIAHLIGQHDNDEMVSFYGKTPAGWLVEIGATGRTITEDWADVRRYERISRWGHQSPSRIADLHPAIEMPPA